MRIVLIVLILGCGSPAVPLEPTYSSENTLREPAAVPAIVHVQIELLDVMALDEAYYALAPSMTDALRDAIAAQPGMELASARHSLIDLAIVNGCMAPQQPPRVDCMVRVQQKLGASWLLYGIVSDRLDLVLLDRETGKERTWTVAVPSGTPLRPIADRVISELFASGSR